MNVKEGNELALAAEYEKAAIQACEDLRVHLIGDNELLPDDVEACKLIIKEASKQSLYFFAKHVLGFDLLTDQTHKKWCEKLQKDFWQYDRLMELKPRGTFKTTIYAEALILWVWATISAKIRFFYTSSNATLLDEVSAHLDHYIGFNSDSVYAFVFGVTRDKGARKNTQDVFNVIGRDAIAKGSSLMFRTAGGSTNGLHPHVAIVDDPADKQDRESEQVRTSKERWFDSLIPLLVPFKINGKEIRKMIFIGTRWHLRDLMDYVMRKWASTARAVERTSIEIEGVFKKSGELRYPELINLSMIEDLKTELSTVFFSCQYLNDPLPEGLQIFTKERLHFLRQAQYDITKGSNYCFLDPSLGKQHSDFPAVFWVNLLNGKRVFFDAIDVKHELASLLALIAKRNAEYKVREFVYETNNTTLLTETLYKLHSDIGFNCPITGIHESRNKQERITVMQPLLYSGSNFFRDDYDRAYPEAMNQVLFYPAWGHDDFPDVIEKALSFLEQFAPGKFLTTGANVRGQSTLAGGLSGAVKC